MATREEIYDAEISPLMKRIIEVCKEHDIPAIAQFQIDDRTDEDDDFFCSTALVPKDAARKMRQAEMLLRPAEPEWCAYVEHADGTRERTGGNVPLPPKAPTDD